MHNEIKQLLIKYMKSSEKKGLIDSAIGLLYFVKIYI